MYKLMILCAVLGLVTAAPRPHGLVAYSAPAVAYSPVAHVVPAVSSYSSYSNSVVHGSPLVAVPLVHSAPVVHSVPLAYSSNVYAPIQHVYV